MREHILSVPAVEQKWVSKWVSRHMITTCK